MILYYFVKNNYQYIIYKHYKSILKSLKLYKIIYTCLMYKNIIRATNISIYNNYYPSYSKLNFGTSIVFPGVSAAFIKIFTVRTSNSYFVFH